MMRKFMMVTLMLMMAVSITEAAVGQPAPFVCDSNAMSAQPASLNGAKPYIYKSINGADLRLHVFEPPMGHGTKNRPAIVFFFGGGWVGGDISHFAPQAEYLARRGMVAIIADYRVFCRHKTGTPEAMTDARSAIRWVRSHAGELHIDPDRIAAGGGSAGGQLAFSTTFFDNFDEPAETKAVSSKPNALVLFNPVIDLTEPLMVRNYSAAYGRRGKALSPAYHIAKALPPTVIFHGKADILTSYASAEKYCSASRSLGNDCTLFGYDGAGHGFFNPGTGGHHWYEQTMQETDRFLTRLGYLARENQ